ncbi:hypothetical protein [Nisaea nitritireducens]|uniref:hypothetical protein n=1 Tax=Nisaea nitritireducens TaxID=568392 RepID=UPI0018691627|nr:hypothetical protein [Nisaea nitritireducens]
MVKPMAQIDYIRMPSEPPSNLVETLQRDVFYNDDVEIGLGLSFHCYRRIYEHLRSHGMVLEYTKPEELIGTIPKNGSAELADMAETSKSRNKLGLPMS